MVDLNSIVQRLNGTRSHLLAVTDQISAEAWNRRPAPEAWSAAEVIAHLTMVEELVVSGAERAVQKEPRPVPFWKRLHLPPKISEWRFPRVRTPVALDPALLSDKESMLARFRQVRERTLAFLEANRERDLARWHHTHPFFGSLNMYSWFKTLYHHEIRHTKQLREIVKLLGGVD